MLKYSLNESWVYYTSQNKNPYYNGYLFAQNQTRLQGNNTGNTLYGIGMAQNQPPLHYPAMLKPYSIYQNPVPSTSNLLQIEPDRDNTSPSSSELSNWSDDWKKHSSWSLNEERYLIAAYKGYYYSSLQKAVKARKPYWRMFWSSFKVCALTMVWSLKSH